MQNLAASLFAQLSPKADEQAASRADLDEIIDSLRRRQEELHRQLARQAKGPRKRRLKTALEIAQLQEKKALALRSSLPST